MENDHDRIIHSPHDAAFKSAFQKRELAKSFFQRFIPEKFNRHIDYRYLKIDNKSYVDEKFGEMHSDIVYRTKIKKKAAFLYILFEHQSTPDYRMAFRLLCYMINIWKGYLDQNPKEKYLPVIIPIVIYQGKIGWTPFCRFADLFPEKEEFAEVLPDFIYQIFNLGTYDNNAIEEVCGDLSLSIVFFLMKNIFEENFDDILANLMKLFVKLNKHPNFITMLEWALRYSLHARNENEEDLRQIIVNQTSVLNDPKIREVAMTAAEQIEQRGIQKGIIEGKLRGEQYGRSVQLITLLKKRFGKVTKYLEKKIMQADLKTLDRIVEAIFDFKSIGDVEKIF